MIKFLLILLLSIHAIYGKAILSDTHYFNNVVNPDYRPLHDVLMQLIQENPAFNDDSSLERTLPNEYRPLHDSLERIGALPNEYRPLHDSSEKSLVPNEYRPLHDEKVIPAITNLLNDQPKKPSVYQPLHDLNQLTLLLSDAMNIRENTWGTRHKFPAWYGWNSGYKKTPGLPWKRGSDGNQEPAIPWKRGSDGNQEPAIPWKREPALSWKRDEKRAKESKRDESDEKGRNERVKMLTEKIINLVTQL